MTSKFSQAQDTQSLPPVCRAAVVMLPTWQMPPNHPITALTHFIAKKYDGSYLDQTVLITLPWIDEQDRWSKLALTATYYLRLQVLPNYTNGITHVQNTLQPTGGPMQVHIWHGPTYEWPEPWKSGDHLGTLAPFGASLWQTLYQLIP